MMNFLKNIRAWQWALAGSVVLLSMATWAFLYSEHLTLVYNDARSYLNISRMVVDNQQPGLAQIGSVWLPLVHVIKLPFIWIDWMWQSGFAGSVFSMAAYVAAVIGIYAIVKQLTNNRFAGVIASGVAALNANLLYLQSTPLTEPLYLAMLVWSAFFLIAYVKTSEIKWILPLAFAVALQILTRYDGWFVAAVVAAVLLAHELWVRRATFKKALGHVLLFVAPVAFTCLLWFGWNAVIFGDPLYFMYGPGSAHAQQQVIDDTSGLITKGHLLTSLKAYGYAVAHNVGWWVIVGGAAGWIAYIVGVKRKERRVILAVLSALLAVFAFNVIALFLGFSSINVPELNWNTSTTVEPLFNVRYGILMLPLAAIGAGLLAAKWRYAAALIVGLVAFYGVAMVQEKPITLQDGTVGASAFVQENLANALSRRVGPGDDVLMSMSVFNPLAFDSGLQLKQIIHEGVRDRWQGALDYPEGSVDWIVMGPTDADPVHRALDNGPAIRNNYKKVYQDQHGIIYERIKTATTQPAQ